MQEGRNALHFFLCANTPQGFVSRYAELGLHTNWERKYLLKGGPGTGKSTLIRAVAEEALARDDTVELIRCSSDTGSLDAAILHAVNTSIADATPPHGIEPSLPGAFESVVNLSALWDEPALRKNRAEIAALSTRISALHERNYRFLAAIGSLLQDSCRLVQPYVGMPKLIAFAQGIAKKEFPKPKGIRGTERLRFLSAVGADGICFLHETPERLCERFYVIQDEYGCIGRAILGRLRDMALDAGLDIYTCYCPMSPYEKIEHILIPSLSLGFMTSNRYHTVEIPNAKIVNARRFLDQPGLRQKRQRLTFNRKAVRELLGECHAILKAVKEEHDRLEAYYIAAMDWKAFDAVKRGCLTEIDALY